MTQTKTALTVDQARELAADLLRELTPQVGDRDAINAALRRWVDVLDAHAFSLVCIAALHMIFVECLTSTPLDQLPPDRLVLIPNLPNERKSA